MDMIVHKVHIGSLLLFQTICVNSKISLRIPINVAYFVFSILFWHSGSLSGIPVPNAYFGIFIKWVHFELSDYFLLG